MFRSPRHYGELNGFDLLKLVALAAMVIDHLGYYLFPQVQVLRAVGRMAFPLFLFMVGYSGFFKVRHDIVTWAVLITLVAAATFHAVFPIDILVTIMLTRLVMAWLLERHELNAYNLTGIFLVCLVFYPLFYWTEYSTLGVLFALCGYLRRNLPEAPKSFVFLCCTMALYFFLESFVFFSFQVGAWVCLVAGLLLDAELMRSVSLAPLKAKLLPAPLGTALAWCSRNTLPIYGLHVILLMIVQKLWHPEWLPHFQWFSF